MGNCALKPKVLTETGAPAPENPKESLLEYQKLDSTYSLGLEDAAKEKPNEDEKIMSEDVKEKAPENGDGSTASVETKPPVTDDKNSNENQETVDVDDLKTIDEKKVVEDVLMKRIEISSSREKTEKKTDKKEDQTGTETTIN